MAIGGIGWFSTMEAVALNVSPAQMEM